MYYAKINAPMTSLTLNRQQKSHGQKPKQTFEQKICKKHLLEFESELFSIFSRTFCLFTQVVTQNTQAEPRVPEVEK